MKLVGRQPVDGTERPVIYIGKRVWKDSTGKVRTAKPYTAEYFLEGKQQFRSLKLTNKVAAIQAAHELHRSIRLGEPTTAPAEIRLEEMAQRYLATVRGMGRAPKTLQKYELVCDQLLRFCNEQKLVYANRFSEELFWSFAESMNRLSEKTRHDRLIVVQQLFKWGCERAELIAKNPIRKVRVRKPPPTEQPCFTPEQVTILLANANEVLRPRFATLAYTGMRFGELRDLRWADVRLDGPNGGFIHIKRGGAQTTKGRNTRRIPIHGELRPLLEAQPRHCELVFPAGRSAKHPNGDGPMDERRLLKSIKRLCTRCGFDNPNQYKLHTFRHSFASMLARNNIGYRYALEFMGQSSSAILDLYYTMFDDDAAAAIASIKFPPTAEDTQCGG